MIKATFWMLISFFGIYGPSLWWPLFPALENLSFVAAYLSVIFGLILLMYSMFCFKKYFSMKNDSK